MKFSVGTAGDRFFAHRNIFRHPCAGDFYSKALTNGTTIFNLDVLVVPEDDPRVFEIFVKWLYGICLGVCSAKEFISSVVSDTQGRLGAYAFAQKYRCSELQDIIMSDMYDCVSQSRNFVTELSRESLEQFVTNVPKSHMHTLLAKWIAKDISLGDVKNEDAAFEIVPNNLLRMVMREMHGCARDGQAQHSLGRSCDYHLHSDDDCPGM